MWIKETSTSEPPFRHRYEYDDIETEGHNTSRDKSSRQPAYRLGGVRCKGGVNLILAHVWNCGNRCSDVKGDGQVKKSEPQSTNAG